MTAAAIAEVVVSARALVIVPLLVLVLELLLLVGPTIVTTSNKNDYKSHELEELRREQHIVYYSRVEYSRV